MTTQTQKISSFQVKTAQAAPFSLVRIAEALFAIDLREKLARSTSADQSDAVYAYGL